MFKYLLFICMLLTGIYVSFEPEQDNTINQMLEETVLIVSYYSVPELPNNKDLVGSCAGVWVGERHIITAAHCAPTHQFFPMQNGEEESYIRGNLHNIYLATIDYSESQNYLGNLITVNSRSQCDLSVLEYTGQLNSLHPIATLRSTDINIGENVSTVGHPGNLIWVHTSGEVADTYDNLFNTDGSYNIVDINLGHGSSGGGLFDSHGRLVGIARAISISGDMRLTIFSSQMCLDSVIMEAKQIVNSKRNSW